MKCKRLIAVLAFLFYLLSAFQMPVLADYIADIDTVKAQLASKIAYYAGASNAVYSNGKLALSASPYISGTEFYIPLDITSSVLSVTKTSSGSHTYINGTDVTASLRIKDSETFISASAFADAASLYLFDDELSDLIIIGRSAVSYTWHNNRALLSGIIGAMIFDFPSAETVMSNVSSRYPASEKHPRILAVSEDFERIKAYAGIGVYQVSSPMKKQWLDKVISNTASVSSKTPVTYGPTDHIRMRVQSEQFYTIAAQNAFLYKLKGTESYAQRAWTEIEAICSFPDWNPCHLLDTGQFMNGMALAYDWLYDWLSEEQKQTMRENIIQKGLQVMCDVYDGVTVYSSWRGNVGRNYGNWFNGVSNWDFVTSGGAVMAALSIFDDCTADDRAICGRILEEGIRNLSYAASAYSPSGDWYEGPSYWALATETMTEAVVALQNAAGTDYGIMDAPGVSSTGDVPFALIGEYSFNYSNAGEARAYELPNTRELFYLARRFDRPDLASVRFMLMDEYGLAPDFRDLIYCTQSFLSSDIELKKDYYLKNSEIVTMRNTDAHTGLIFAAIHGGANAPAQGHLDVGEFVIDSFGSRFASDLGLENYNLEGEYYNKYRNRAEGHNTIIINPDGRMYDQSLDAVGIITRHENNEASSLAVVDMTSAYTGYAQSATRAMKMINDRTSILLKDEIRGITPKTGGGSELYWFMHTKADITLLNGGRTAQLDIDGNKMYVQILSDDNSCFTVMNAQPLPTSPQVEGQNANAEYKKLAIHYTNITDADITVCFTPEYYYDSVTYPAVSLISGWTLDETASVSSLPKLTSVKVNGSPVPDFSPDRFRYEYTLDSAIVPSISALGGGTVSVNLPDSVPGSAEIHVTDGQNTSVYTVHFNITDVLPDNGYQKLDIINIQSPLDDIYETADELFSQNATLNNSEYAIYDFGQKSHLNYITLSGNNVNLAVYSSKDGVSYERIADISGSGNLKQFIGDAYARYIKIISLSDNTQIKEISFYGYTGFEYIPISADAGNSTLYLALFEKDTGKLAKLEVYKMNLDERFSFLSPKITVPSNGKQYRLSAYLWQDETLSPIISKSGIE